jgi:hypothetical protein
MSGGAGHDGFLKMFFAARDFSEGRRHAKKSVTEVKTFFDISARRARLVFTRTYAAHGEARRAA